VVIKLYSRILSNTKALRNELTQKHIPVTIRTQVTELYNSLKGTLMSVVIAAQMVEMAERSAKENNLRRNAEVTVKDSLSREEGLKVIGQLYAGVKNPTTGVRGTKVKWVSSRSKGDRSPAHPNGNPMNEHTFVVL
jgi:hypothetical protein